MTPHHFIFTPGIWIGEGKITFSTSPDFIKFYTKWQITEEQPGTIKAVQTVEMHGIKEHVVNNFTFVDVTPKSFALTLESEMIGSVNGKGLIDARSIAWEFRGNLSFEGFEVYELQENGDYFLHAEYSSEQFRTIVEGLIWKKGS